MQIGISLPHFRQVASPGAVRSVAREAEELGFDSIWVTDHVVLSGTAASRFGTVFYEPLVTLTYALAVTNTIRIGTSAIILPYRNPIVTAKQLSTIDVLSGGRLIFGCAAGWSEEEFDALGVDFKKRGQLSDDALRMIKGLWTEPQFIGMHFEPPPLQKPHPPIWVGGNSRRGVRRAVEFGNYWHPTRPGADDIRTGKNQIREIADRIGRNPNEIGIAAREPLKVDETISADKKTPFIGPKNHIIESFLEFKELGVSHFVIDLFYSVSSLHEESVDSMTRSMKRFANDIRPGLSQ